jgi:hypothetical protein
MISLITHGNLRLTLQIALILLGNTGNELAVLLALELTTGGATPECTAINCCQSLEGLG